jgi:hypothetical protein
MGSVVDKKKQIVEESPKTRKAREKLKRQLEANDKKITAQALEKKTIEIHRWIERHAQNRVVLKSKSISLFDENQNTADVSHRVSHIVEQIGRDSLNDPSPQQISKLKKSISKK